MADRFYTPDFLAPGEYTLTGSEAHHVTAVRRFTPGDNITLFNGDGNEYPATLLGTGKKSATLNILSVLGIDRELPFPLVIASAIPKGDRADFLIEKLTELGVTRFLPLITERSVVHPKEATLEKFSRAVIEASKQCGRNRLMTVDPARTWDAVLALSDLPESRFVLHTGEGLARMPGRGPTVLAIGPEGGFSPGELERSLATSWTTVSVGSRILRVETAAVAAAAILGCQ